ncbi:MAG: LamG domain-containing protein [Myxococcota bacterium]
MYRSVTLILVWCLLWTAGCRFDPDLSGLRQCETTDDCATYGEGLVCQDGDCQQPDVQCSVDADCIALLTDLEACEAPVCDAAGQCQVQPAPTGTSCADSGTCAPGRCDEEGSCVIVPDDTLCDNGQFCDGEEACIPDAATADERGCVAGEPRDVEDGVSCTVGSCDEEADAIVQDCSACDCCGDDDSRCGEGRQAPQCFGWTCSETSYTCQLTPSDVGEACDDGVACTMGDTCDASQTCTGTPSNPLCDDGAFCNGEEVCDPTARNRNAQGCIPGDDIVSDGINCTIDTCDEAADEVFNDRSGCSCQGDSDCQARCFVGSCVGSVCAFEPAPEGTACDDGLACTTGDACDGAQRCLGTPDDATCDDGAFCTGAERCAPDDPSRNELGCITTQPMLDDGVACTLDSCDEETDQILHDDTNCACTTDSDCRATCRIGRCVDDSCTFEPEPPGTPCDDGIACTTEDVCSSNQECRGRADDTSCDDGSFCNGAETCQPDSANQDERGCVVGILEIDDGIPCTRDFCDEEADSIVNDNADCDCRTDDDCVQTCQAGSCVNFTCQFEPAPGAPCDDGIGCTVDDTCSAELECVGMVSDAACDDTLFCNGPEVCTPDNPDANDQGCTPGRPPNLDDGLDCTVDTCDEELGQVVHDSSTCQCTLDEECDDTACIDFSCDQGACVATQINAGAPCDDGFACTTEGTCNAEGLCVAGSPMDANCADSAYCNGAETCQPDSPNADGFGCLAGTPPLDTTVLDPCETAICDDDTDQIVVDNSACCVPGSEGPFYLDSCFDGIDNDCNDSTDSDDEACAFAPDQFAGLVLWLDATRGVDVSAFGGISNWDDRSPEDNDADGDFLDWLRPRPRDNAQNGRRVIDFDGGDDRLYLDNNSDYDFGTSAVFFVVFKVDGLSNNWQAIIAQGDDSWRIHRFGSSNLISFGTSSEDGSHDLASTSPIDDGGYHIVSAVFDNGAKSLYFDGALEGTATTDSRINASDRPIRIGENSQRDDRHWNGRIGEILIYNGNLSEDQRRGIEVALAQRWGLTLR